MMGSTSEGFNFWWSFKGEMSCEIDELEIHNFPDPSIVEAPTPQNMDIFTACTLRLEQKIHSKIWIPARVRAYS